jgi:tetraacyldisaccharide 4'-kinase
MMESNFIKINKFLLPFSYLYGFGVWMRNKLFDLGFISSRRFDIPVISVGNITVGGTGKTPHVEYLIRLLLPKYNVGVLSRGYKRKSHGFVLAGPDTQIFEIGDEPYQMKSKFPGISMAVDANRCRGIERMNEDAQLQVILLDDAFQHRYVQPGINILLVDYFRLICDDALLPAGRLREPERGKNRANVVIVTKCPKDIKPMDFRIISKNLNLYPYQTLYFTHMEYDTLQPLFPTDQINETIALDTLKDRHVILLTGIASPMRMIRDLEGITAEVTPLTFSDHHSFKQSDLERMQDTFNGINDSRKLIITTEKDAVRLRAVADQLDSSLKPHMYVLPMKIEFMVDKKEQFDKYIISYVTKNKRNSDIPSRKDAYES